MSTNRCNETVSNSDLPLPYSPRHLTPTELKRKDIYGFWSPKIDREVWVTGALTFAACLRHEFDTAVRSYCERPRYLQLTEDVSREIAFWTRLANGEEYLWLVVPTSESDPMAGGKRRYRWEREALEAAERSHVRLRFLLETELIALGPAISTWLSFLPYVQTAHLLPNGAVLEARLRGHFDFAQATTFAQVEAALGTFNAHDVRSAVCRAIHEGWLMVDATKPLHIHTVVRRGESYERN